MRVETLLEDDRVFESGRRVTVIRGNAREDSEIEFSRKQHGRLIVKLRGVNSISEVERLVGAELAILETDLPPAGGGAFYTFHLKGCEVVAAADGEALGTVTDVLDGGGTSILVVDGKDGEILIPFAQEYLAKMDLEHRRIEVNLPDGLRDLNK
jgi:16S rRNA processing protein RimM